MTKIDGGGGARYIWLPSLLLALTLAACRQTTGATGLPAEVSSPESLSSPTRTARLPELTALQTRSPLPSPSPLALGPNPLPARLAQIPLAPAGQVLGRLLSDPDSGRLYVTDSAGTLHVVDAATYEEVASFPVTGSWEPIYGVSGSLALDAAHHRLYVAAETRPEGVVTVVDTAALSVVGSITPGGAISLDSKRNRLYVGRAEADNPIYDASYAALHNPTGKVYDAGTLMELGEPPVKGRPVYDPLADELLIVSFTVYRVDPDTLQVTGDLLPDISAQPCPQCSGVSSATDAHLEVDRNLVTVHMRISSAGHSPPCGPGDRYFNATTLEPVPDPSSTPPFEPTCNGQRELPAPVRERAYASLVCQHYVDYRTLLVYTLDGEPITSVDGMTLGLVNPNTCQSYVPIGDRVVVLDLPTLAPVGALPLADYTLDAGTGRLYGLAGADLLVFAEQGGQPEPPPPPEVADLPARKITLIRPSPDYANDHTVFVGVAEPTGYPYNTLYRSTDGGETWVLLRGGLPQGDYVALDLAVSPGFASDRTLFAGGFRGSEEGLGVFRSTDGGDTWQPTSEGLGQLQIDELVLSPDYPSDGALLAYTHGGPVFAASSRSVYRSTDRGEHWALVATGTAPNLVDLLPPGPNAPPVQFRLNPGWLGSGGGVDRWTASTRTWRLVFRTELDDDAPAAVLSSPAIDTDHTVYVLTHSGLWRSTDLGETWERCPCKRLDGRQYDAWVTAGALAGNRLLVGTMAGEFFSLDVTKRTCEPVETSIVWPTVLSGEWVRRIEAAPGDWAGPGGGGDVWLATQRGGVYHYADGAIQAQYAISDGLHSQDIWGLALAPAPSSAPAIGGALWVAGQDPLEIASFDGQTWTAHTPALPGDYPWVVDLAAGPDGSVWAIGVWSTGGDLPESALLRWTEGQWEQIGDPQDHLGSMVYDIDIAVDGSVWVATIKGLAHYRQGTWASFDLGECSGVALGPEGEVYAVTAEGQVWRYAGDVRTALPPPPKALPGFALYVSRDGAVWIATVQGVSRYDGRAWRDFTPSDGLPGNIVECIAEDAAGQLWFGTANGAAHVDPATLGLSPVSW
jgi:hypothetical protein